MQEEELQRLGQSLLEAKHDNLSLVRNQQRSLPANDLAEGASLMVFPTSVEIPSQSAPSPPSLALNGLDNGVLVSPRPGAWGTRSEHSSLHSPRVMELPSLPPGSSECSSPAPSPTLPSQASPAVSHLGAARSER